MEIGKKLSESISLFERIKIKLKTVGRKKPDLVIDQQMRPSGETKRPAVSTITTDRSKESTTTHEVKERKDNGDWETVHKHHIPLTIKEKMARLKERIINLLPFNIKGKRL